MNKPLCLALGAAFCVVVAVAAWPMLTPAAAGDADDTVTLPCPDANGPDVAPTLSHRWRARAIMRLDGELIGLDGDATPSLSLHDQGPWDAPGHRRIVGKVSSEPVEALRFRKHLGRWWAYVRTEDERLEGWADADKMEDDAGLTGAEWLAGRDR